MQNKLRRVRKEDLKSILKINNSVQAYPWTSEALRTELEHPQTKGWVSEGGVVPGKVDITGYLLLRDNGSIAEIMTLGVGETFQRNGIARGLLSEAIGQLPQGSEILLEVSHVNEGALTLYKKIGFKIIHTRKAYYPDGSDAVCMKLNIANP